MRVILFPEDEIGYESLDRFFLLIEFEFTGVTPFWWRI